MTQLADGTIQYTPDAGFVGVDYFVYVIGDGQEQTLATVRIDVVDAAPPPVPDEPQDEDDLSDDDPSGSGNPNSNGNGPANNNGNGQANANSNGLKNGKGLAK